MLPPCVLYSLDSVQFLKAQFEDRIMGLLTDPGAGRGKLTRLLVTYHNKLCVLLYLTGMIWFIVLAHDNFNAGTYFSENALLPGLVKGKFDKEVLAKNYQVDLVNEAARYPDGLPYSWLLAKFRQLSLDAYTHNFTLNYPLGAGYKYSGRNVYAILRAPRSASTEALVLSAPYRPPNSVHPGTIPSIAIMLSLAKFFRRQKYWAKDIIFLITEHEQLGVQAWLEAYHKSSCGRSGVLEHGDMVGRGGAIQAAINLELHSERISHIDVKIEGLNGQLPNLDLVNLVHKMCSKESVRHTFKNKESINFRDPVKGWLYSLKTLMAMVSTQATGIPNGNHGLFHRFGIEAVTLEGFEKKGKGNPALFSQMGRVLEGLFRSLNNLLERFHQSYFFYLLPATDRYISIGMYMPPLGLLCTALIIKAFALWLKMQEDPTKALLENKQPAAKDSGEKAAAAHYFSLVPVGVTVLAMQTIGIAMLSAPQYFSSLGLEYGFPADISLYSSYVFMSVAMLFVPAFTYSNVGHNVESWTLLNIVALLELGTLLLCVSMQNFSLALLSAVIYVPPALWMTPTNNRLLSWLQKVFWLLVHPLSLMTLVVMIFTVIMFPEEPLDSIAFKGLTATRQALIYSIVDSYIYANWIFPVATAILLPNWLLFWVVIHSTSLRDLK